MNIVTIIGRTTTDIELKTTNSGKMVCSFTLAVPKNFKKDEANFIPVVFWEKQAEALSKYVKKGQQIAVSGELTSRKYEKDGKTLTAYEVQGTQFTFCGAKQDGATNPTPKAENGTQGNTEAPMTYIPDAYMPKSAPAFEEIRDDADLPF